MKPKYKDFSLPIIGRRYQILYDPDCPDVTYDELKIFIMRLKQEHRYEDVAVLLERYDYLLKDQHRRTKKFNNIIKYMVNNGERIKNIEQVSHSNAPYLTDVEESVLNGTYEDVDFAIIRHVAFSLTEKKMTKELDQLLAKYKDIIIEGNARLLIKYHNTSLPEGYATKIEDLQINQNRIDGMAPLLWKVLHVPDFIPQKAHLKHLLKELEQEGKYDEVTLLENKYEKLLFKGIPEPELSSEEASELFDFLLSSDYHSMFEKSDNTCELNNNQPNCIVDTNGDVFLVDEDGVLLEALEEENVNQSRQNPKW